MSSVASRDGTKIAFELSGDGPPVVLVDGALGSRSFGAMPRLAALLTPRFSVITYDRRGRGDSGDTQPYAVEREVEDIDALIAVAGGSARIYGISSGAALALEAAIRLGDRIELLAMYEAPYTAGERQAWKDYTSRLREALAEDRRGDAVALFMRLVGVPEEQIDGMRGAPMWAQFEAVAPTLAYDAAILGAERAVPPSGSRRMAPALIMNGDASFPFMRDAAACRGHTRRRAPRARRSASRRRSPGARSRAP